VSSEGHCRVRRDPLPSWPGTWFVGRGDVISNFGKAALVPNLAAEARFALTNTVTCTYPDGTVRSFSGTWTFFRWGDAQPRYAPGSDLITGYFAGPDELWHGDDAGAQFYSDLGCPAPGSNNPYLNDPAIPRTAVDTGTSSFYVNGRLLFGPELIYGPVPHT